MPGLLWLINFNIVLMTTYIVSDYIVMVFTDVVQCYGLKFFLLFINLCFYRYDIVSTFVKKSVQRTIIDMKISVHADHY